MADYHENGRGVHVVFRKYMEWNKEEIGRPEINSQTHSYWYRGPILYRGWSSIARFVPNTRSGGLMLFITVQEGGLWGARTNGYTVENRNCCYVDSVGATGPEAEMVIPDSAFLNFARRQWLAKGRWYVNQIAKVSNDAAWRTMEAQKATKERPPYYFIDYRVTGWRELIKTQADYYAVCSYAFSMLWKPYPLNDLLTGFDAIVASKVESYKANAPKRERKHARKQAIIALQLNTGVESNG